jgi:hypothetical protein
MTRINTIPNLFSRRLEANADRIAQSLNDLFDEHGFGYLGWKCISARTPYRAEGLHVGGIPIVMEWIPGKWLSLRVSKQGAARSLIWALSEHMLGRPADLASVDSLTGDRIYEWRLDGVQHQWRDLPAQRIGELSYTGRAS